MIYAGVVVGADVDLAATARAIAEPARAAMLLRLMDRQAHTAGALAEAAGISRSTASTHLRHLVNAGLVTATIDGRRRLHVIASPGVAAAIEAIAAIPPMLPAESLREARTASRLQIARVCYGHLGGWLAVAITRELRASGVVDNLRHQRMCDGNDARPPAAGKPAHHRPRRPDRTARGGMPGLDRGRGAPDRPPRHSPALGHAGAELAAATATRPRPQRHRCRSRSFDEARAVACSYGPPTQHEEAAVTTD